MSNLPKLPRKQTAAASLRSAMTYVPVTCCLLCISVCIFPLTVVAGGVGIFLGLIAGIVLGCYLGIIVVAMMDGLIAMLESEPVASTIADSDAQTPSADIKDSENAGSL